jgi:hypothetical protein
MGKKNDLEEERKKTLDDICCETEELEDNNQSHYEEQKNIDIESISTLICQSLVEYSEENAFSLCEYLDMGNVFVFVEHITH